MIAKINDDRALALARDVLDIEADSTLESVQPEGLAGLLLKLGLNGVPVTLVLTLLFAIQKHGTATVGKLFAPIMLIWFLTLAVLAGRAAVVCPAGFAEPAVAAKAGFERPILHGLASYGLVAWALLRPGEPLTIACDRLIRIDFGAAGSVLNWAAEQQSHGHVVQFHNLHRLVAVFFNVIGVNEHAWVVPRKN